MNTFLTAVIATFFLFANVNAVFAEDSLIYGCFNKNNGQLRVVTNLLDCNSMSEKPISWDSTGGQYAVSSKSLEFPQGIEGTPVFFEINPTTSYTVPEGKTLYITNDSPFMPLYVDGVIYYFSPSPPMFTSNTTITYGEQFFGIERGGFSGILIDNNPSIIPVTFALDLNTTYTVPDNKTLVVRSGGFLTVNGAVSTGGSGTLLLPAGSVLGLSTDITTSPEPVGFTGYLIDN